MNPIDLGRLEVALATSRGWLELAVALLCIALAWALDRRLDQARAGHRVHVRFRGSLVRIAFPLMAVVLTYVASFAWRRYVGPPFFLAIATSVLIALAVIRMIVYGLRRLFPSQAWLPASEVWIALGIWALVILYFLGVLPEMSEALDELVIPFGKSQVSLLTMFKGVGVVLVTLVVTLWISGLIEQRLAQATHLDANLRVVLSKAISAVLIVVGVLIALQQIGFDLTLLTVFGGALGVGIGLGLQKLASNYIAGFTILLDRSIRLGDLITVDNKTGVVTKVSSRYVVVRSGDGLEAIVPNETLVTTTVLNHSYTSNEVRIALPIQVAYDTDVDKAIALLEDIATREPRVLRAGHGPVAHVIGLADSGITLELGVWIADPHIQGPLRSTLYRTILKEFAAAGIRIPYPQRDVRVSGSIRTEAPQSSADDQRRGGAGTPGPSATPP
jgi:small-conductance mechanosensitive channel